jgi:hypothetical protein
MGAGRGAVGMCDDAVLPFAGSRKQLGDHREQHMPPNPGFEASEPRNTLHLHLSPWGLATYTTHKGAKPSAPPGTRPERREERALIGQDLLAVSLAVTEWQYRPDLSRGLQRPGYDSYRLQPYQLSRQPTARFSTSTTGPVISHGPAGAIHAAFRKEALEERMAIATDKRPSGR